MIGPNSAGLRADLALSQLIPQLSRRDIQKLCDAGRVVRRQRPLKKSDLLLLGDLVTVYAGPCRRAVPNGEMRLNLRLETKHWVVVAKPAGTPTAPRDATEIDTLANALVAAYPEMAGVGHHALEPGLLHRLDNGTSGLLVAARSAEAFQAATRALKQGHWKKRYLALVHGCSLPTAAVIEGMLEPDRRKPERVLVPAGVKVTELLPESVWDDGSSPALQRSSGAPHRTRFAVLRNLDDLAYVEVSVGVAFRHQIRAHFAAAGWPLVNDVTYGATIDPVLPPRRHALHAARVAWSGSEDFPGFDVAEPLTDDLSELLQTRCARPWPAG